ncbi:glycosyltransferase family 2 protein [Hyphomonas sp.]|jgi:glycosyltransferase involved in cell wall biosynthesis|uniref:glycosyltransferase family 2 protein n=1 Tax=Hyphomonas sp. TaxID=87 RepID=UPI0037BFB71E
MVNPLDQVTPLILTFNEEANISRTLAALTWARRIVVVDSCSTDRTLGILRDVPAVELVIRPFDTHASQWNAGLDLITTGWVLSLDADYIVTPSLLMEMASAIAGAEQLAIHGFRIPFRYCIAGRPLRGTVLPPRIALFCREHAFYRDDGHTQDLQLSGLCSDLRQPIFHDDRKPLSRWLWAQNRYLALEVSKLMGTPLNQLSLADRLRKRHVIAPFAVLILCLIRHGGLFDGWRGWFYAFQRMYVETLLSLMLWEARSEEHRAS